MTLVVCIQATPEVFGAVTGVSELIERQARKKAPGRKLLRSYRLYLMPGWDIPMDRDNPNCDPSKSDRVLCYFKFEGLPGDGE